MHTITLGYLSGNSLIVELDETLYPADVLATLEKGLEAAPSIDIQIRILSAQLRPFKATEQLEERPVMKWERKERGKPVDCYEVFSFWRKYGSKSFGCDPVYPERNVR